MEQSTANVLALNLGDWSVCPNSLVVMVMKENAINVACTLASEGIGVSDCKIVHEISLILDLYHCPLWSYGYKFVGTNTVTGEQAIYGNWIYYSPHGNAFDDKHATGNPNDDYLVDTKS